MKDYENTLNSAIAGISPEAARAQAEYLVNTGIRMAEAAEKPIIETIDDHTYVFYDKSMKRIDPIPPIDEPQPRPFLAFSLRGLVDYIKTDVDGLFAAPGVRHIVSVCGVDTVKVYTPITGYSKSRHVIAECRAHVPDIPFNRYIDPEDFQIMVQTRFQESDNRKTVLKLAGNIKGEQSMQTADDGVSQKVTIKKGVATAADVIVSNPVVLTPLRTFYEVEQPSSPFVIRFSENAQAALFEGDGGAWMLKAVENIRTWLEAALLGYNVEVIA